MTDKSLDDLPIHEADVRASLTFGNPLALSPLSLFVEKSVEMN